MKYGYGKSKEFRWLRNKYIAFNKKCTIVKMLFAITLSGFVLRFLDIFSCQCRFSSWFSIIGPIDFVIWTFTVTLVVFYLGRMEDKRYGVRVIEIMPDDLSFRYVIALVITFLLQLVILIVTLFFSDAAFLIVCTINQVIMMIYVFIMVGVEISSTNVRDKIVERSKKGLIEGNSELDWALLKALLAVNFQDYQEVEDIEDLFFEIVEECYGQKEVYSFSEEFTGQIINICSDKRIAIDIINTLLSKVQDIEVKRGIIAAVLLASDSIEVLAVLNVKFEDRYKLMIWGIAYCSFYSQYENLRYLSILCNKLQSNLYSSFDVGAFLEYWVEFAQEENDRKCADEKKGGRLYLQFDKI